MVLGKGEFSSVELTKDRDSGIPLAIKRIAYQTILDKSVRMELVDKLAVCVRLRQKNILHLFGYYLDPRELLCVIMEYAPYGNLMQVLNQQGTGFNNKKAVCYARDLIMAVQYCHLELIKHRDILPKNILFDFNLCLKFSFFGPTIRDPKSTNAIGYFPPETDVYVKDDDSSLETDDIGHTSSKDSYLFGIILYMMITGKHPFLNTDSTKIPLKERMRTRAFERPMSDNISKYAIDLIDRLLCPFPEKRTSFNEILSDSWFTNEQ